MFPDRGRAFLGQIPEILSLGGTTGSSLVQHMVSMQKVPCSLAFTVQRILKIMEAASVHDPGNMLQPEQTIPIVQFSAHQLHIKHQGLNSLLHARHT